MAADFKFPNEIDPLGSNLNRALDFQKMPPSRHKQISVRVGEIIRGKIVEVVSPQVAVISLPDGTFTAEISGKFQSGDELFFRVQSVEPSLVLKIYSVFTSKENKYLPTSELLRILDLPKTSLFELIVSQTKEKSNILFRDEIILQAKYANNLLGNNPKTDLKLVLNFINFALENNIEPSNDFFTSYSTMFKYNEFIPKLLTSILMNIEYFPEETKKKVLAINNALKQSNQLSNLIKLLSPNFFYKEDNIINILFKPNFHKPPNEIKSIIEEFHTWFNAFWIVNASSTVLNGSTIYFIMPYIWKNNPRFTIISHRRKKHRNVDVQDFTLEDEELVQPIIEKLESNLNNFFSSDEKNEFTTMLNQFRKQSKKEESRLFITTPLGKTQIIRLLTNPPEATPSVSIVI